MPCRPISPLSRTASPGRTLAGEIADLVLDHADAGRVDEDAVALASVHDLGVAGDQLHPAAAAATLHRLDDPPQRLHRQAFFQDQRRAEIERPRAAHGQIVHRAVDGERADIAAGKEQRSDNVGIGREGQPGAGDVQGRAIVPLQQEVVAEAGSNRPSSSSCMRRPPPPCASCTCRRSFSGAGHCSRNSLTSATACTSRCTSVLRPQAPVAVVGGARSFGGDHRCAQRMIGRAARAERRTLFRLLRSLHDQAADALAVFLAPCIPTSRSASPRRSPHTRRRKPSPLCGMPPMPRHLRSTTRNTFAINSCAGGFPSRADRARILVLDLRPALPPAAARTCRCPAAGRAARSR